VISPPAHGRLFLGQGNASFCSGDVDSRSGDAAFPFFRSDVP